MGGGLGPYQRVKIRIPSQVYIKKFPGGYSIVLYTNIWYTIGNMSCRLTKPLKSYYGKGAKARCLKYIEDNGLIKITV